jgi:hypothetical protein
MNARTRKCIPCVGLALLLLTGCGPDYGDPEPVTSFAIVRASSSATSYEAEATFMSPYQGSDCSTSSASNGCAVTYCNEAPAESERVAAGALTIQGSETVVLDEENSFSASADRALFSSGDDVLLDLVAGNEVPSLRRTLSAPSGSSLTTPPPVEEPTMLELKRHHGVVFEWAPGESGFMRASFRSGLVALACQWDLDDGVGLVESDFVDQLPSSEGTDSVVEVWTEQSDAVRKGGWEFLLLLQGVVSGARYSSFLLE